MTMTYTQMRMGMRTMRKGMRRMRNMRRMKIDMAEPSASALARAFGIRFGKGSGRFGRGAGPALS